MAAQTGKFAQRLSGHEQELKEKYMELYHDEKSYEELLSSMKNFYDKRSKELKPWTKSVRRPLTGLRAATCWA